MSYQKILKDFKHWLHDSMTWFSNSTSGMDVQTAAICGGVFVFSALVVYLISVFGMRERTYEEAMEEQRRRNQEALHQTKSDRTKKEKKFRKWGKKSKEKIEEEKTSQSFDESKAVSTEIDSKLELDGNSSSPTVEMKEIPNKRRAARQRKPLVIEKEEDCSQPISSSDDSDNLPSLSISPLVKQPVEEAPKCTMSDKSTGVKDDFKQEVIETAIELQSSFREKSEMADVLKAIRKSPSKKSKRTKADHIDFCSELREGNEARVLNFIKSNSLTEEEVQHILEVLGSKHKINEKKKSEISALKKVIQEKEEALRSEQKQCHSANERMSDLIQELAEARSQATANEKSLRDALHHEQQEIKSLHGMMQRKREQYSTEVGTLQSKISQMKNKMKEEHTMAVQRMQEENVQLQNLNRIEVEKQQRGTMEISRLQHEVEQLRNSREKFETHQAAMQQSQEDLRRQIQIMEKQMDQLRNKHQDEEYSYKQRMTEMSNKLQQTDNARSSLVQELQNAQSVCSGLEVDNAGLRQRLEDAKHQLKGSEQDLLQLQSRLEESNRQQRDLANCLEKMRDEVMDLSNFKREQLQVIQTLKQENEVLVSQVNQRLLDNADQKKQNGDLSDKSRQIEVEEHEAIVQEKENMLQRLLQEIDQCKCEIMSLSNELEIQKKRSKELTDKNCELVGLLQSSEKKLQDVVKNAEIKVQEAQKKVDNSSKEMQNLLNEQIKEVELTLRETYAKELKSVQLEAENAKKEAEEKLSKSESEANIRLEEFQESLYERLNELNSEAEIKVNDALKEKEEVLTKLEGLNVCIKHFLQRIFPNLDAPDCLDNETSLTHYESEVKSYIESLKGDDKFHDSKDLENMIKKLDVASEEKTDLEAKIKIYESVLAETENILKNLQNNIENEEKRWKIEMNTKDETLKEIVNENEELKTENKTLKTNLEQLQGLRDQSDTSSSIPVSVPEDDVLQIPELFNLPNKSEKKKKSRKKGGAGKK